MRRTAFAVFTLIGLVVLLSAPGCSLNPFGPKKVTILPPGSWRDGPPIAGMDYYALFVSGGSNSNTLRSSDVGNRSLSCLGFLGSVHFPKTFAEITSGISFALPAGTYTFKFVGISAAGSFPGHTTIGSLFAAASGGTGIKAFTLAERTATVTLGGQFQTTATYNPVSTPELVSGCPPQNAALHAAIGYPTEIEYLKRPAGGSWTGTLAQELFDNDRVSLYVDDSGFAHISFGSTTVNYGVRYSTNLSGAFIEALAIDSAITAGRNISAISGDAGGNLYLLTHQDLVPNVVPTVFIKQNASWPVSAQLFSATGNFYDGIRLVRGGTVLMGAGHLQGSGSPLLVSTKAGASWDTPQNISSAGLTGCSNSTGSVAPAYAPDGGLHLIYLCTPIASTTRMAYAKKNGAAYDTAEVFDGMGTTLLDPALAIDSANTMYMVYGQDSGLFLRTGNGTTGVWGTPTQIGTSDGTFYGIEVIANGPADIHVLTLESRTPSGTALFYTTYDGVSWNREYVKPYPSFARLAHGFYQK